MNYNKILTIQDISCVGQCSLTVALPVISACGHETCVLPSAVLSTHTYKFKDFTFADLTEEMPKIKEHWQKEGITFNCIYTGYLGSLKQIDYVAQILSLLNKNGKIIVDPAMADNGVLYYGFNNEFVKKMAGLCAKADYVLPNITEACFITDTEYKEKYDKEYVLTLISKLNKLGCKNVILTGISYNEKTTGVVVSENGEYKYYEHEKLANGCHGTGDIYASAFVGALMRGKSAFDSAKIAADYVLSCIKYSKKYPEHWYGAIFEPCLKQLITAVNE